MRSTVEGTRRAARVFASATALGLVLSGGMITTSATAATLSPNAKSCAAKHPGKTASAKKMRASCVKKLKARSTEAPPEVMDPNGTQTNNTLEPDPSPTETPDPDTSNTTDAEADAGAAGGGGGAGLGTGAGGDADANANTGDNENANVNEGNDSENENNANAGGGGGGDASNDNDNDATGGSADNDLDSDITNNNGNVNNNTSSSNVSNSGNSTNTVSASGVGNPTAYATGGAGASNGPINVVVNLPPMTITIPMPAAQTTAVPEAATRSVVTSASAGRTVSVPARVGLAPAAWTRKNQAARIAITGLPSTTWQVRVQDHGIWRTLGSRTTVNGKVITPAMRMLAAGSYLLKLDRLRGTDYFVIVQVRN